MPHCGRAAALEWDIHRIDDCAGKKGVLVKQAVQQNGNNSTSSCTARIAASALANLTKANAVLLLTVCLIRIYLTGGIVKGLRTRAYNMDVLYGPKAVEDSTQLVFVPGLPARNIETTNEDSRWIDLPAPIPSDDRVVSIGGGLV